MPMLFFIMMAVLYTLFFLHDRLIVQSFAMRRGEALLWQQDASMEGGRSYLEAAVLMMEIEDVSNSQEKTISETILSLAGSYQKSQVRVSGRLPVGIRGIAVYLGDTLSADVTMETCRIAYVDDYLKTGILHRMKSGK